MIYISSFGWKSFFGHLIAFMHTVGDVSSFDEPIEHLPFLLQSGLTLSSDGILGPLTSDLPAEGLDLSEVPPAED